MRLLHQPLSVFAPSLDSAELVSSIGAPALSSVLAPAVPSLSPFEEQPAAKLVFAPPGPGRGFTMIFAGTTPFPVDD